MRSKIRKFRSKISSKSKYSEEFIDEIESIPTYDLFTPEKVSLICEDTEVHDLKRTKFLEHREKSNSDVIFFLVVIEKKDIEEINPIELYLRYSIDDSDIPHYPGDDYKMKVHNTEVINSVSDLSEYDIKRKDLDNISQSSFPALKLRTQEELI
jgi:hypothetical protein